MKFITFSVLAALFAVPSFAKVYSFTANDISGNKVNFSDFKDKVLLIVNTASKCGFTPQYKSLQKIYRKYKSKGFSVVAFPSGDFANQEFNKAEKIKKFCRLEYGIEFPLMMPSHVRGDKVNALFKFLTKRSKEGEVKWNFEKFLIDKKGRFHKRFSSRVEPDSDKVIQEINYLLENN